ncbi:MAG TPA: hypothetical protein HPP83_01515 [Candidatus Hydrogenedentes bacterium]|nr:hypothetical protein [Candidatus Hydrogenedentota bacterium]
MKRGLTFIFLTAVVAFGCVSNDGPGQGPATQLDMRHFQTRSYATTDVRMAMKAMLNVLQDLGFMVNSADADLGLITAEKWANIEHTKKAVKRAQKDEVPLAASVVLECTANVSVHGDQCRVRVTFQKKLLGTNGAVMEARVVDDAAFYQEFFGKVDKSIFLQREGI